MKSSNEVRGSLLQKPRPAGLCLTKQHQSQLKRDKEEQRESIEIPRTIIYDISVEEELRLSEEKFSKAFASTPEAITISTLLEGVIIDVNESFTRLTGYTREEVIGHRAFQFGIWVKEEDRTRIMQALTEQGHVRNLEMIFRNKSGQEYPCLYSAETIEIGHRQCVISVVNNITEQRQIEDRLKKSEERHRLLAENVADVMWTVSIKCPSRLTYVTPSIARLLGYTVDEAKTKMMEEVFTPYSYQVAMRALGEEMARETSEAPDLSKSRTLELELIRKNGTIVPVEIRCSFIRSPDGRPVEILVTARDISERKQAEEEHRLSTEKLVKAMEDMIQAMARIVEMRDPYTAGHQRRVAKLACEIAQEIGLPKDRIVGLRLAALIHDIGKIRVPAEILSHPAGLSEAEFTILRTHPVIGYEITKNIDLPWPISQTIHQHHERMDGSGYPSGISGEKIILEARVLAVADVVEAISSHRPYRPALGTDKALAEISQQKGRLFDATVVDACLKLFRERGFKFE